jgi:UDP-N-acetylmuramoyl-tripeptide--D-alanyl-D-alanine ligase
MNIEKLYTLYTQSYKVSTDTRKITQGCLFFALKGANFNGNQFAEEALKKGAAYAIVDEKGYQTSPNIILVEDVLTTLQTLATYHRKQLRIPVIGLTGSNGKTTTKELINAVLSTTYKVCATKGNLNNHIGVPLTLLSMNPETEMGIVEMGANHLEEIAFLCSMALPDYGYITNFGKAHLEGFGSLEGVVKGKTELYRHLKSRGKIVFVNANDAQQVKALKGCKQITFGDSHSNANIIIEFVEANPFVVIAYNRLLIKTCLIGDYNFNNCAAAIAMGSYFKVSDNNIKDAIESYVPDNNRSQIIEKGNNKIILDAYNANPSSMVAALENLSRLTDTRKIAILGDMFELGKEAATEHHKIADFIAGKQFTKAYLIGENFYRTLQNHPNIKVFKTFEDFKNYFSGLPIKNTTLLIKASRGMALERILELL